VLAFLLVVLPTAWSQELPTKASTPGEAFKAFEEAASKAGAGEEVPVPDPEMSEHEAFCQNVKGWCPTVTNGVIAGLQWCLGKPGAKTKPKCFWSHLRRAYAIYMEWRAWLESVSGGFPALYMAGTIRTESEGQVDNKSNSWTIECGLAGVDYFHARDLDINACDPQANTWAAGYSRNQQLINARKREPNLALAPIKDQWLIAGAMGAIGSNKVDKIIDMSGALKLKDDGTLVYKSPAERIFKWLMFADKKFNLYSWQGMAFLGPNPGKGGFRVTRPWAQDAILGPQYVDGVPWGEPVLPDKPADILPFPGKDKHCQCWRWPELKAKRPDNTPQPHWPNITVPE